MKIGNCGEGGHQNSGANKEGHPPKKSSGSNRRKDQCQSRKKGYKNQKEDAMLLKEIDRAKIRLKDIHHKRCCYDKNKKNGKAPKYHCCHTRGVSQRSLKDHQIPFTGKPANSINQADMAISLGKIPPLPPILRAQIFTKKTQMVGVNDDILQTILSLF